VDEIGFLAKVYSLGTVAYVGGGFGAGVHNVMEPACFGIPVFLGPKWSGSREAALMLKRAGAFSVKHPDGLTNTLSDILDRDEWRTEAGQKALDVVKENLGATDNTIEELHKRFPDIYGNKYTRQKTEGET
jgi:3-deoxy-D-manno-octulosonic-acid transferase